MSIITETKHYAGCPECGSKVGPIDHLIGDEIKEAGPWFCDDCGCGWRIRTNGRDFLDMTRHEGSRWMPAAKTLVCPNCSLATHAPRFPWWAMTCGGCGKRFLPEEWIRMEASQ
jgi:hypothetical protein